MSSSPYPSVALGEVLSLGGEAVEVEVGGEYRPAGIRSFGKGLFARPAITGAETKYPRFTVLREGQFVYSRLFGWEGALAVVPAAFDGMHVSQEFPVFDVGEEASHEYLQWLCRWPELWSSLRDSTTGLGDRRQRVAVGRLLATEIPLPPVAEQQRLARRIDGVAERNRAVRGETDGARRARAALTASTFGGLADSAPSVTLGEVLSLGGEVVEVEVAGEYRPAGIRSFGRGLFARPAITGAETKYPRFTVLREGQFVYSKVGSWEGAVAVVPPDLKGLVVSAEYPVFDLDSERLERGYLDWVCRWPGFHERLVPRGSMVRRKRVNPRQLLEVEIPLPPLAEQQRLGRIGRRLKAIESDAAEMDRLLDALMPSAIGSAIAGDL